MCHIPPSICEVLAVFEINAKDVDEVGMKWKSPREFETAPRNEVFPFAVLSTIHRRNYNA